MKILKTRKRITKDYLIQDEGKKYKLQVVIEGDSIYSNIECEDGTQLNEEESNDLIEFFSSQITDHFTSENFKLGKLKNPLWWIILNHDRNFKWIDIRRFITEFEDISYEHSYNSSGILEALSDLFYDEEK
jgi:hypothetical protein